MSDITEHNDRISELVPDGILTDLEGAKKQLMFYRSHYPFRKWCACLIMTRSGELWVLFDSPAKMKRYARKHGLGVFNSISY